MGAKGEIIVYGTARALSIIASISVFSLIARNKIEGVEGIFFLSFVLGFSVALLRTFCSLNANLNNAHSRCSKLRKVTLNSRRYARASPILYCALAGLFLLQDVPTWASFVLAGIVILAGYESDLTRAIVMRCPLYPSAFMLGSLLSLALLVAPVAQSKELAMVAITINWLPVCVLGYKQWKVDYSIATIYEDISKWKINSAIQSLLYASLPGLIINAPFLGGVQTMFASANGLDLAIAGRIFSSAHPLLPLIDHWSNAGRLHNIAKRHLVSEEQVYAAFFMTSSIAASTVFILIFTFISNISITVTQYGMFAALLLSYCLYATKTKHLRSHPTKAALTAIYVTVVVLLFFYATVAAFLSFPAWTISVVQSLGLLLSVALIGRHRMREPQN